ncbi:MAG TPA: terminase small subunit, partial [Candidatus Kapabacteria bacterium]|nr:terminase small subunit [Candidatus Kapabacteria bacterium]
MNVGRPLKFGSLAELQSKINEYFETTLKDEWTITGLALALDTTRQTLCNYEEKDEFLDTIKKAKLKVENGYEVDLKKHGRTGTIFALKNFDWKDKTEVDQ